MSQELRSDCKVEELFMHPHLEATLPHCPRYENEDGNVETTNVVNVATVIACTRG
jgi:hypothetical protein|tara:strand:+ start:7648 stop:7812 length:165 start_codon:yes stop_codon:yes gene_type:complete